MESTMSPNGAPTSAAPTSARGSSYSSCLIASIESIARIAGYDQLDAIGGRSRGQSSAVPAHDFFSAPPVLFICS
jgi:hypothetical protein